MAKDVLIVPASGQIQLSGSSDPAGTIQSSVTTISYDSSQHNFTGSLATKSGSISIDSAGIGSQGLSITGQAGQVSIGMKPDSSQANHSIVAVSNILSLRPRGTTVLNALSTGRVGIGTTNPGYTFDVSGNARFTSEIRLEDGLAAPAVGDDIHLGDGLSTTPKIRLGTSSWLNNYGLESYWSVFSTNSNEGYRFKDSGGNELLRIQGNTSSGGAGTRSFNVLGVLVPMTDSSVSIGTSSLRWTNIYTDAANIAGNITVTGTVDGRDVASDGSKLDGIESGATADQSAAEILTAIKTVDGAGTGLDADLLDGVQGTGYVNTTSGQTIAGTKTFSTQITGNISGYSGNLIRTDNRIISPSEYTTGRLNFGFTSWGNNNSSPWADFIHLRGYTDSSGGKDHLLMFKKTGGSTNSMRIWSQDFGSSTAYSSYADVVTTDDSSTNVTVPTLTITGLSNQSSENTVVTINGSNVLGTRELGSNAFNSTGYLETTGGTISGNLTVTGTVTAEEFHTEFVSSSILFKSGSTKSGNSFDDLHNFTGSVFMDSSGSGDNNVFVIDGEQGRLFSVVDETSGSLFSANTVAGLPVIEAFSDNTVTLGPYSSPINITSTGNISGSATSTGSFGQIRSGVKILANTTNDAVSHVIIAAGNIGGPTFSGTYVNYEGGNNQMFANNDFRFSSAEGGKNLLYLDAGNNTAYFQTNVGIGISSTTKQLHLKNTSGDVRGILVETTVATSYAELQLKAAKEFRIGTGGSSTTPANQFYIYDAGAGVHRFDIDTNGNIGINDISPSYRLDVNGTGRFTGNTDFDAGIDVTGNITVTGTVDGIDIAGNINQGVKTSDNPTFTQVQLSSLSNQSSETTALVINGSNVVGTRELGSNAFNSTSYLGATSNAVSATALSDAGGITTDPGSGKMIHNSLIPSNTTGIFSTSNNANSIITINKHPGNYYSQLGFNSGHDMFIRGFNNRSLSTGQSDTWYKVWTQANDGASSGLDSDLLDGQHGSYYRNVNNMNAGTLGVARGGTGNTSLTSNSVLTGNGTAAIQAESGLTFDGTALTVDSGGTSRITIDGNNSSGDDGNLQLYGHTTAASRAYLSINNGVSSGGQNWYVGALRGDNSFAIGRDNDFGTNTDFYINSSGVAFFDNTIEVLGQNLTHGASRIKIGQESTALSEFRFYGADTSTAGSLRFMASNSDGTGGGVRMMIASSGNIGIGTSSPANTLHLQDGNNTKIRFSYGSNNYTNIIANEWDSGTVANNKMRFYVSTGHVSNTVEALTLVGNGKVGIGTTSPSQTLDVNGSIQVGADLRLYNGTSIRFHGNGVVGSDGLTQSFGSTAGSVNTHFNVGGVTAAMVISGSTGNVGIGTTTPGEALEINKSGANLKVVSDNNVYLSLDTTQTNGDEWHIFNANSGATSTLQFKNIDQSAVVMLMDETGNVGIGTTSPDYQLELEKAGGGFLSFKTTDTEIQNGDVLGTIQFAADDATASGLDIGAQIRAVATDNYQTANSNVDAPTRLEFITEDNVATNTMSTPTMVVGGDFKRVGIGTNTPLHKLHIEGTDADMLLYDTNTAGLLTIKGAGNGYINAGISLQTTNGSHDRGMGIFMHDAGVDSEWFAGIPYAHGHLYTIGYRTSIAAHSNDTAQTAYALMTIKNNGRVGIGDTDPQAKLHVELANHDDAVGFYNGATNLIFMRNEANTGRISISGTGGYINLESSNSRNSYINTSANFGIGTASPSYKIDVSGTARVTGTIRSEDELGLQVIPSAGSARIELESSNAWSYTRLRYNGSVIWDIASYQGGDLQFRPAGSGTNAILMTSAGIMNIQQLTSAGSGKSSFAGEVEINSNDGLDVNAGAATLNASHNGGTSALYSGYGFSTATSQTILSNATAVNLQIGGSTKLGLTSATTTVNNALSVPSGNTSLGGKLNVASSIGIGSYGLEKTLEIAFANGVANQKAQIQFTKFWGELEISLASTFSNQNAAGVVTKRIGAGLQLGNLYANESRYTEVLGVVADNFAIGEITWDSTNSRYFIPIVHRVSTGNTVRVRVRCLGGDANQTDFIENLTVSSVYTTDTTAYAKPKVSFVDGDGLDIQAPLKVLGNNYNHLELESAAGNVGIVFDVETSNTNYYDWRIDAQGIAANTFCIGHSTAAGNQTFNAANTVLALKNGPLVGIGTTTPIRPLDIAVSSGDASMRMATSGQSSDVITLRNADGRVEFGGNVLTVYNGNVGINNVNPSEALHITSTAASATPVILLENSNANNLAPQLNLYNNSASPADDDYVGQIDFEGNDSGGNRTVYARIIASSQDVTNTIEDGMLFLQTQYNGTLTSGLIVRGMPGGAFVGIGGQTNPSYPLDVTGRVRAYGNNTGFVTGTSSAGISSNGQSFYIGDIDGDDAVSALYVEIMAGTMLSIDEDDASFATNIKLTDNHKLRLGTGADFDIYHSGTHSYIDNNTGGLYITSPTLYFGSSATGGNDIYIYGDTSGRYIQWDASAERLKLFDNVKIGFGTGVAENDDDGSIYSDGTNVIASADGLWRFTSNVALNATGKLYFDAGSNTYIHEHSADTINVVTGGSTRLTINSSGITVNGTVSGNLAGASGMRGYFFFGDPNTHYSNQSSIDKTHYLDMAQGHQANASYHGVVMPRAGSITAVSINYDTILSTASQYSGQYTTSTLKVYKNSSNVWNAKTLITSGVAQGRDAYATVADGTYTFSAGDVLKLVIFSDDVSVGGAYSRVGFDDITAYIEVTFDN